MTNREKAAAQFVVKANKVHNSKYDYSEAVYVVAKEKVRIRCFTHGIFEKTPNKHLNGQGCPKCSSYNAKSTATKPYAEFKKKADSVHKNKYTYAVASYCGSKAKMNITCPIHGLFTQTPDKHINSKQGCPLCGTAKASRTYIKSNRMFIRESIKVHGSLYCYTNVMYTGAHNKVRITCEKHGEFEQSPSNHLAGKGCRRCATSGGGFDSKKSGKVYYVSIDDGTYYKIGITNRDVWTRFSKDEHHRIKIVKEWEYLIGRDAQIAETKVLREHKSKVIPKGLKVLRNGNTEVFIEDVLGLVETP